MRKVQFFASFWTIMIVLPFTFLAIIGVACLPEHLTYISNAVTTFSREISVVGQSLLLEFSAPWPEIAGMVIGMILILTIFLFAQFAINVEDRKTLK